MSAVDSQEMNFYLNLASQILELREVYPSFNWETERHNEEFLQGLSDGLSVKDAYEKAHRIGKYASRSNKEFVDYYAVLGVPRFCDDMDKIKNAYRSQIKFFHPDANNVTPEIANIKTIQLNEAFDVITNPAKKEVFDSQLLAAMARTRQQSSRTQSHSADATSTHNNSSYRKESYSSPSSHNVSKEPERPKRFWVIIMVLCVFVGIYIWGESAKSQPPVPAVSSSSSSIDPDANLTPRNVYSGQIFTSPSDDRIAPLEVITDSDTNYYIYLKDLSSSGKNSMSFYVTGGRTEELDVPLGTYQIYYYCGDIWYGKFNKFGSKTTCYKCDKTFKFTQSNDYVNGYTITLYKVANGNMGTDYVSKEDWPN